MNHWNVQHKKLGEQRPFISFFCIGLNFFSSRKFEVNIWSSFEIKGNPDMTLEGFIKEVEVSLRLLRNTIHY